MVGRKFKGLSVQMIVTLCLLILFPLVSRADVMFTIGDGSGSPGSTNNSVTVSLANDNKVRALQVNVRDGEDYLTCAGCGTTGRTTMFECSFNELEDGRVVVLLSSLGGDPEGNLYLIEEGSGPIFTLKYDVSTQAPPGECKALTPEGLTILDEQSSGIGNVTSESGQFCFTQTASTTTTTGPIITTTTTTIPSSCEVSVSPLAVTIQSGDTIQFNAKTSCGEGTYAWQIDPGSTIGSTISGDGLFTAGDNTTDADIEETVKVTDSAHENKSATATVTIRKKQEPVVGCEVSISPLAATVSPEDTLTLQANTIGDCDSPLYEWDLTTETNSLYDPQGDTVIYTAGENKSKKPMTDTVTVTDTVNEIDAEAVITITNIKRGPCLIKKIYSENAEEVAFLRNFRDEVLSKSPSGGELIRLYYEWGPTIIKVMEENEEYKREIKEVVDGVLMLIGGRRSSGDRYGNHLR